MKLTCPAPRTEILRVRFTPDEDQRFRKFCSGLGVARATLAYRMALDAMAHVRPREPAREETKRRPLRSRRRDFPGSRERIGAPSPHLRV